MPPAKRDLAYSDASLEVWPSLDGAPGALSASARRARAAHPACLGRGEGRRARYWLRHRLFDRGACPSRAGRDRGRGRAGACRRGARDPCRRSASTMPAIVDGDHARGAPDAGPYRRDSPERQRARGPGVPAGRSSRMAAGSLPSSPAGRKAVPAKARPIAFRQGGRRGERRAAFRRQRQATCRASAFAPAFTF